MHHVVKPYWQGGWELERLKELKCKYRRSKLSERERERKREHTEERIEIFCKNNDHM